jgi:phospholipid/cholesterol/gamma-HCH transport system ATP-binding protein
VNSVNQETVGAPDEIAVLLRGVQKSFDGHAIYRALDLELRRGETLTVLGPSGVGKSVMLKLVIGLFAADAGQIVVDGTDVTQLHEGDARMREVRRRVGMLFQGAALFDSLSVADNVAYGLREHYRWPPEKIRARVAECLEWVGLPHVAAMRPADLSGGMKKRVGLARALAPGPDIILYDEPTTGLDPTNTRRINELIVALQEKLNVSSLVITHDMQSALAVADRVALLEQGRILVTVDADEARARPPAALEQFMRGQEAPEVIDDG